MSYQNDRTTGQGGRYDQRSDGNPVVETMQFPFEQAAAFQRATAGMVLVGLELVESTQRAGADLTRSMARSYRDTIEEATDTQGRDRRQDASRRAPPQQQPRQYAQPRQSPAELPAQQLQQQPFQESGAQYQGRQYEQEPAGKSEREPPQQSTEPAELQQTGTPGQPQQQPPQ